MPVIPEFPAASPLPIERNTASANIGALAAPGQATEQLGTAVTGIGNAFARLQEFHDTEYYNEQRADATLKAHDRLTAAEEEAQSTGNYQGFAQRQRQALDADLAPRIAGAGPLVGAKLKPHFATLTNTITARANAFEHGMAVDAAKAGLATDIEATQLRVERDPSLAGEEWGRIKGRISGAGPDSEAGRGTNLFGADQQRKRSQDASNAIWSAEAVGRAPHDPSVMADLKSGKYDAYLDFKTQQALQPRIEGAIAKGIVARLPMTPDSGGGGASGSTWEIQNNNFGGLRKPGVTAGPSEGGFQSFASPEGGVSAISQQLDRYASGATTGKPLTTLRQIVSTWAPPNENPTEQLIARAAKVTGFAADQALDVADPATKAKLIEATIRNEQAGRLPVDPAIITKVAGAPPPAKAADASAGGGLAGLYAQIDKMGLDPDLALKVKTGARINYDALETDQLRQQRMQEKAATERTHASEDKVIADAYSDAPKITAQQVANDPAFADHPEARLRMIQVVRNAGEAGPAAGPSHMATLDLVKRINLPDGDPQKITDRVPILGALGSNTISKPDFDFAMKQLADVRDPAGETLAKRKAEFLKGVEPQIDKTWLLDRGRKDAAGALRLYDFQVMVDQRIEEAKKANKNPFDLLTKGKPDYLGTPEALQPYKRTFQQMMDDVDKEQFGAAAASAAPKPAAPPPEAAAYLKAHPDLREPFERKYGAGSAAEILDPQLQEFR